MRIWAVLFLLCTICLLPAKGDLINHLIFESDASWKQVLESSEKDLLNMDEITQNPYYNLDAEKADYKSICLAIELNIGAYNTDNATILLTNLKKRFWDEKEIRKVYFYFLSDINKLNGDYNQAISNLEKALYLSSIEENNEFTAVLHLAMSDVYYFLGEHNKGLAHVIKVEQLSNNEEINYYAKEEIALHLLELNRITEAFSFLNDNLTMATSNEDTLLMAGAYAYLGIAYYLNMEYEKSIQFQEKALNLRTAINDESGIGESSNNIFLPLAKLNRYEEAEVKLLYALDLFERLGDERQLPAIHKNLAEVYFNLKNYKSFNEHLDTALALARKHKDPVSRRACFSLLAEYYSRNGDYQAAFKYHKEEVKIGDSLRQINAHDEDLYTALAEVRASSKKSVVNADENNVWWIPMVAGGMFLPFLFYRMRKRMLKAETELEAIKAMKQGAEIVENIRTVHKDPKLKEELLNMKIHTKKDALTFKQKFAELYPSLYLNILEKYPNLTESEKRMLMLIRLGLNNDLLADKLAVSASAIRVTKYRLRKKLNVTDDEELKSALLGFSQN